MIRPNPCPNPLCTLDMLDPSACDDCPNVPTPRGGRRAGAGAPVGNLNALKHGQRSKQLDQAIEKLAFDPEMRPILNFILRFAQRQKERS